MANNNGNGIQYWLAAIHKVRAIAQAGLTYTTNPFDHERFTDLQSLAAEMLANISKLPEVELKDIFASEIGYSTPKLDVRAGLIRDDKILLVRESADNKWSLPGGFADVNESPSEAAVREVLEEVGYEVVVSKFVALYDKQKHDHPPQVPHAYKMFFLCDIVAGTPKTSIETTEYGWFSRESLPELSVHRVVAKQIDTLFLHHSQPELKTEFD